MATLATFFRGAQTAHRGNAPARAESDPFRLRPFPNDAVFIYTKPIDNSRLTRQANPADSGRCWSAVSAAAIVLMIGASIIAPNVASVLAGYKLEALKQEHQSLADRRRELDVREAALLSPERLNELAKARQLASPSSAQVVHLDSQSSDGHFARAEAPSAQGALSRR